MSEAFSVVFRYRDLVGKTIEEHSKIIAAKGWCWWGWWKRPPEDAREDVWGPLQEEITRNGHAYVGLFHSGDESVRVAKVTGVVPPQATGSNLESAPLGEEQLEHVPDYYRKSPFSRAWLKLEKIGEPIPFFGKYSFASAPKLPRIEKKYLEALKGKKILDADELRAMDTTIWDVRSAKFGDSTERFVAPTSRTLEALSSDPIALRSSVLLHLTDMHFADGIFRKEHAWAYPGESGVALADEIGAAAKQIGLVVITGDFTFVANEEEFKAAAHSINSLLGTFGLGPDHLILVPGNHDIAWTKTDAEYDPTEAVSFDIQQASANYRKFYRVVLGHDADDKLSMARRFVTPSGIVLDIGALNSSSLETGKRFLAGMGRCHPSAFREVRTKLGWDAEGRGLSLRILALHHHLTATEDIEDPAEFNNGFGMAVDAKLILREAAEHGVHLCLHGHRHRAFVWRETVYGLPEEAQAKWELGSVLVLGGGSAGSSSVHNKSNYFNTVEIGPAELLTTLFRSKELGAFKPQRKWRAAISVHNGRLEVAPWASEKAE